MNRFNINHIAKTQLNKMLNKEGLYVRELHTNSKIKVLFRKVGNSSVMSERIKIYYHQNEILCKGSIIKYQHNYYLLINQNDFESEVFCSSECIKCNGLWNIHGQIVPVVSDEFNAPTIKSGAIKLVSGKMSVQTQDMPALHTNFFVDTQIFAFGVVWKCINKFYIDGIAMLHFERIALPVGASASITYYGETVLEPSTTIVPVPEVRYGDVIIAEPTVNYSSSNLGVILPIGDTLYTADFGASTVTMSATGDIENGTSIVSYSASADVVFNVVGVTEHSITILNDGNGTASASATTSVGGATITLTEAPNTGYVFKEWEIVTEHTSTVILNNTFIMPNCDIVIRAVFEESIVPVHYVDFVLPIVGGTCIAVPSTASAGTTVTLTAVPDDDYEFVGWTVVSGGVTITNNQFTMPNDDVVIGCEFSAVGGEIEITHTGQPQIRSGGSAKSFTAQTTNPVTWSLDTTTEQAAYIVLTIESDVKCKVKCLSNENLVGTHFTLCCTDGINVGEVEIAIIGGM